jgi:transcriptional regulator with XRE-family HTH domain
MKTRTTWTRQVTARVRAAIKASGYTEEAVGDEIGVSNATFSRSLNCHRSLSLADLENIAVLLGKDPEDFLPPRRDQQGRKAS